MKFIILFVILSMVNVIFSTVRSITTIKSEKTIASLISAGYFAFYNIMLIYTVADFPMWQKCIITFCCNFIGVWVVKLVEEKMRKDKLWKVEATILQKDIPHLTLMLNNANISHSYIENLGKHAVVNCYCETQTESKTTKEILNFFNAKYFVSESKTL